MIFHNFNYTLFYISRRSHLMTVSRVGKAGKVGGKVKEDAGGGWGGVKGEGEEVGWGAKGEVKEGDWEEAMEGAEMEEERGIPLPAKRAHHSC